MQDYNQITIIGRLATPLSEYNKDKNLRVTFVLANNQKTKNGEYTNFVECVVFGKTAELMSSFNCEKGDFILVKGSSKLSEYVKDDGKKNKSTSVVVDQFQLLKKKTAQAA